MEWRLPIMPCSVMAAPDCCPAPFFWSALMNETLEVARLCVPFSPGTFPAFSDDSHHLLLPDCWNLVFVAHTSVRAAHRLFIGLADTVKVTANYSWSACLCLQRTEQFHWLCQRRFTPLTFLSFYVCVCVASAFCFISVLVCVCSCSCMCLRWWIESIIFVCVQLSVSVSSCCCFSFGSLAFSSGLSLIVTLRLLLLLPHLIYLGLVCLHVFVQPGPRSENAAILCAHSVNVSQKKGVDVTPTLHLGDILWGCFSLQTLSVKNHKQVHKAKKTTSDRKWTQMVLKTEQIVWSHIDSNSLLEKDLENYNDYQSL